MKEFIKALKANDGVGYFNDWPLDVVLKAVRGRLILFVAISNGNVRLTQKGQAYDTA
jgi:hypothetical protein